MTAAVLSLPGCQKPDGPVLVRVTGVVRYHEKPIAGALVVFAEAQGGPVAEGVTDSGGAFRLKTMGRDGAVLGQHGVSVLLRGPAPPIDPKLIGTAPPELLAQPGPPLIPVKYFSRDTSGLSFDIQVDGKNHFDITLVD